MLPRDTAPESSSNMKVLVVVSALLGVCSAALSWGNPGACLSGLCAAPYAAGLGWAGGAGWAARPYAAGWAGAAALPYASGWAGAAALPYAAGYAGAAALPYASGWAGAGWAARPAALAYAAPAPVAAVTSNSFHAQDELGQYKYGYSSPLSAKTEAMDALGGTAGAYTYLDANGIQQTVKYVADAGGFRVKATNLPVAPVADLVMPVNTLVGPAPVDDTAEVKAAKAEFMMKFAEAAAAAEAAPDRRKRSMPVGPEDTLDVKIAKAMFARRYNAELLRNAGVVGALPTPVLLDTPAVMAAKAQHAALYNQAAVRAAAAPDIMAYGGAYAAGYAPTLRSGLLGARRLIF